MITPKLNPNGSSFEDLIHPRIEALIAIENAIAALKKTAPGGRDYPGDSDACAADREEHYRRIAMLRGMRETIGVEILALIAQK